MVEEQILYGKDDRYDFVVLLQGSLKGQLEVIRAKSILATARLNRMFVDKTNSSPVR